MTASGIYEGHLSHARLATRRHAFRYRVALQYVDLDEVDTLLGGRLTRPGFGLLRFRRSDYFGDRAEPLAAAIRSHVQAETGRAVDGPVRVLTQLRSLGHCFNPVSFYYCFNAAEEIVAIVAEVTNTPWGERHAYVLVPTDAGLAGTFEKQLHVSPFFGSDQTYAWKATPPGETLQLHLENFEDGTRVFSAGIALHRRAFDARMVRHMMLRYPFASLRALTLIYAHAVVLRLKGVPVVRHPGVVT